MRCFIAVDIDPRLRHEVEKLQAELRDLDTKLVEPENLHFTMKFLGEVDEGIVNSVKALLKGVASRHKPFSVALEGVGVFPSEKFVRVVWIGAAQLSELQDEINKALSPLFMKEKSSPHLTIARVRSQKHLTEINDFIKAHKNEEIGTMYVSVLKLKNSTLTPEGPVYEDVAVFKLVNK
ncbi:MAG: RNA 2',3'-cyclic phosphodiesterase [Candidatus Aenigmatarchaeota archaeon]